jgi:hypothetical protein
MSDGERRLSINLRRDGDRARFGNRATQRILDHHERIRVIEGRLAPSGHRGHRGDDGHEREHDEELEQRHPAPMNAPHHQAGLML